jgi:dGTPase
MNNYSKLGFFTSKGRLTLEPNSSFRTPFQRDRDRIIHSASFRRLKHKTQVFVNTEGDHYRTRITHSLEVAQIARSISRYLNLNDDLVETLSLAHDMGHTPFGHAGEEALNESMTKHGGFKQKINFKKNSSLEAQIAAISDDIAYNNHDIQDGIKAKLFSLNQLCEINFFKQIYKSYKTKINRSNKDIIVYQIIRDSINLMVQDVIKNSIKNLKKNKINTKRDVQMYKDKIINFSSKFLSIEKEVKLFLKVNMYNNKTVQFKNNQGKKIVENLFKIIEKKPKKFIINKSIDNNKYRAISDYISGMTDRYAIQLYKSHK